MMTDVSDAITRYKQQAGEAAAELVESGMVVGLGHGSTAEFAVRRLAARLQEGSLADIVGVPCSTQVEALAGRLGIPLTTLNAHPVIDLALDGADEIDPRLNLIKGGGGALLREKIVEQASRRFIVIADETKLSPALGTRFDVPVEVVPFGWRSQAEFITALGGRWTVRAQGGEEFRTDQGNLILDVHFGPIADPDALAARLQGRAGIVAHGLFLHLATEAIIAGEAGIQRLAAR